MSCGGTYTLCESHSFRFCRVMLALVWQSHAKGGVTCCDRAVTCDRAVSQFDRAVSQCNRVVSQCDRAVSQCDRAVSFTEMKKR